MSRSDEDLVVRRSNGIRNIISVFINGGGKNMNNLAVGHSHGAGKIQGSIGGVYAGHGVREIGGR